MDFFEVLERRRSVRAYEAEAPPPGDVRKIIDAMLRAPSAGDLQAYAVVIVRDAERRARLAKAAGQQLFLAQAPVVLVVFADPRRSAARYDRRGERLYALQDATIAASHAQLAAHALDYGTVWVGAFYDREVCAAVGAPDWLTPICMLAVGRAAERPPPRPRRRPEDVVFTERFDAPCSILGG